MKQKKIYIIFIFSLFFLFSCGREINKDQISVNIQEMKDIDFVNLIEEKTPFELQEEEIRGVDCLLYENDIYIDACKQKKKEVIYKDFKKLPEEEKISFSCEEVFNGEKDINLRNFCISEKIISKRNISEKVYEKWEIESCSELEGDFKKDCILYKVYENFSGKTDICQAIPDEEIKKECRDIIYILTAHFYSLSPKSFFFGKDITTDTSYLYYKELYGDFFRGINYDPFALDS